MMSIYENGVWWFLFLCMNNVMLSWNQSGVCLISTMMWTVCEYYIYLLVTHFT